MLARLRTAVKSFVIGSFESRRRRTRRPLPIAWKGSEELELRLLLTQPGDSVANAQSAIYQLKDAAASLGSTADAAYDNFLTRMDSFGDTLTTNYQAAMQGVANIDDTISDYADDFANQQFGQMVNDMLAGTLGGIGGTVIFTPGSNGGTYSVYTGPVNGWAFGDGTDFDWTFRLTDPPADTTFSARAWKETSGINATLNMEKHTSDLDFEFSGNLYSNGYQFSLSYDKIFSNGHFSLDLSKDSRISPILQHIGFEAEFEGADYVTSGEYSKTNGYMGVVTETYEFHHQQNLSSTGFFSFDTEKNYYGTSSRFYLVNQSPTLAGGILAREENGTWAVGVVVAAKNLSNTWDATLKAYTNSGLQSTNTSNGLTGNPLNLGTVNVTGVSFSGNFTLQRKFFLINFNPNATVIFTDNSHPNYQLSIGGQGSW